MPLNPLKLEVKSLKLVFVIPLFCEMLVNIFEYAGDPGAPMNFSANFKHSSEVLHTFLLMISVVFVTKFVRATHYVALLNFGVRISDIKF